MTKGTAKRYRVFEGVLVWEVRDDGSGAQVATFVTRREARAYVKALNEKPKQAEFVQLQND